MNLPMTDNVETGAPATNLDRNGHRVSVMLEMRPAMDGFAGIPQEVRLLFRGLRTLDSVKVEGML